MPRMVVPFLGISTGASAGVCPTDGSLPSVGNTFLHYIHAAARYDHDDDDDDDVDERRPWARVGKTRGKPCKVCGNCETRPFYPTRLCRLGRSLG